VSFLAGALVLSVFRPAPAGWEAWWEDPLEQLRLLARRGSGTVVFRCLVLALPLSVVWGLIGGWIARAELRGRRAGLEPGPTGAGSTVAITRFVYRRAASFSMTLLLVVLFTSFLLLLPLPVGLVNRFFGIGAILTSLLMPAVLANSLVLVTVLVGLISYGIMPAAIAAEGSDGFDAVSRGYSYLFQRPLAFLWWWGITLAVSAVPVAGVAWLLQDVGLPGPGLKALLAAAGAALALSCFWSLQVPLYLKMRRLVDGAAVNEIWEASDDAAEETAQAEPGTDTPRAPQRITKTPESGTAASAAPSKEPEVPETAASPARSEPPTQPVLPTHTEFSFQNTLASTGTGGPAGLRTLLAGVLWTTVVLAATAWAVWQLGAGAGQRLTPEGLRQAVWTLAEQRPVWLGALATGTVLLGALGLGRCLKTVARMSAVAVVFQRNLPLRAARAFTARTRGEGIIGILFGTLGVELFLITLALAPQVLQGTCPWEEEAAIVGLALAALAIGVLGLGRVAVEGNRLPEDARRGLGVYLANGPETALSAAAALGLGLIRTALLAGFLWLVWLVACESLSWWGGEKVRWMRWGLDGQLWPDAEAGLYQVASGIAGLWFALLIGIGLMYPLALALRWGVVCYLRARQQAQAFPSSEVPSSPLALSDEEQAALVEAQKKLSEGRHKLQTKVKK
jgi:hypothetical protein